MLGSDSGKFAVNVFHGNLNVFSFGNSVQNEVGFNVFNSSVMLAFAELFHVDAAVLHVLFKAQFAGFQAHAHFVNHLGNAVFNHDFRNFKFRIGNSKVNQCFFVSDFGIVFCCFLHAFFIACAQFFNGFAIAVCCYVFVGQFGQFFAFNVLYVYFEDSLFAGQFFNKVFFREGYVHIGGIAFFKANELVFKARDEGVGTNFQRIAFAFAAAERFAVNGACKVDNCKVAFFNYSAFFSFYHFCMAVAQALYLFFNSFVGNFNCFFFNMQFFVVAQFNFRFQGYFNGKFHIFVFFKYGFFYFRVGNRDEFFLFQSLSVALVGNQFKSFLFYSFFAVVHFDNVAGGFAFTEAGDVYLACDFCNGFFIAFVYFLCGQSDFKSCVVADSFYCYVH